MRRFLTVILVTLAAVVAAPAALAVPAALAAPAAAAPPVHIGGTFRGHYVATKPAPDGSTVYNVLGTAPRPSGATAAVAGQIASVPFVAQGRATGSLTVTTPHGALKLHVVGPVQPGLSPLPTAFQWTVVSGTGSYMGRTGHGQLTLTLTPRTVSAGVFSMIFQ